MHGLQGFVLKDKLRIGLATCYPWSYRNDGQMTFHDLKMTTVSVERGHCTDSKFATKLCYKSLSAVPKAFSPQVQFYTGQECIAVSQAVWTPNAKRQQSSLTCDGWDKKQVSGVTKVPLLVLQTQNCLF